MLGRNARERSLSEGERDDDRKCYQPSISSRPCTSRQLVDQLSDHLGIYHAKQIAGSTKHQRVDVLKFLRALTLKQRDFWIRLIVDPEPRAGERDFFLKARASVCAMREQRRCGGRWFSVIQ